MNTPTSRGEDGQKGTKTVLLLSPRLIRASVSIPSSMSNTELPTSIGRNLLGLLAMSAKTKLDILSGSREVKTSRTCKHERQ